MGDNALHLLDVVAHGFLHRAGLPAGEKAQIQFSHMVQDAHTQVVERPEVTLSFAKFEDNSLIDTVLGMLLQSFSK